MLESAEVAPLPSPGATRYVVTTCPACGARWEGKVIVEDVHHSIHHASCYLSSLIDCSACEGTSLYIEVPLRKGEQ